MQPIYWGKACAVLSEKDPVMKSLITAYPEASLVSHGDAFLTLARSIIGQQISVRAASSVWDKLELTLAQITDENIIKAEKDLLRACGLSERKVTYLKDLAQYSIEGRLALSNWHNREEEAIIAELTLIKGIGRWTAEMFLIFFLQRPDIYPVADIGIQKAIAKHYYDNVRPSLEQMYITGAIWQPWRTVASWYLWRSLDPLPVSY